MTSRTKTTKQLAWELGLIRKRSTSVALPDGNKKYKADAQIFPYLIVIDYESTCWENEKTIPQEIIEFPAVLINCHSGKIESEFHYFIQPSENTCLSEFCQQLTGISQDSVDNGIPLSICLRKFLMWLKRLQKDKGIVCVNDKNLSVQTAKTQNGSKLAAFVTWSDWDLGVCLHYETKRKQIMKPLVLDRWIDLRATYRKFYSRRPDGLSGALKDLGINFDGRQHSGLDDARNTATLAYRMICDGCILNITKTLKMGPCGAVERISFPTSHSSMPTVSSKRDSPCPVIEYKNSNTETSQNKKDSSHLCNKKTTPQIHSENVKLSERNTNLPLSSKKFGKSCTPWKSEDRLHTDVSFVTLNETCVTSSMKISPAKISHPIEKKSFSYITYCAKTSKLSALPSTSNHKNPSLNTSPTTSISSNHNLTSFESKLPLALKMPFKTPSPVEYRPLVRITPPLCSCGRRSRRRCVQNPGPNTGRWFFSCPIYNSCSHKKIERCAFFKWETPPSGNKMPR